MIYEWLYALEVQRELGVWSHVAMVDPEHATDLFHWLTEHQEVSGIRVQVYQAEAVPARARPDVRRALSDIMRDTAPDKP